MEEKDLILTEAEALKPGEDIVSPNDPDLSLEKLVTQNNANDTQWDRLYRDASRITNASHDAYIIFASHLENPRGTAYSADNGYIIFKGSTGTGRTKILKNIIDTVDPNELDLTSDKTKASLFTQADATTLTNAIQKNKDIKQKLNKFKLEKAPTEQKEQFNPKIAIIKNYYKVLGGNEDKLKDCLPILIDICNSRPSAPLTTNPIFKILFNAETIIPSYLYHKRDVISLYNLFAKRYLDQSDVINAPRINSYVENLLPYNENFYAYSQADMEKIFDAYDTLTSVGVGAFHIFYNGDFAALADKEKIKVKTNVLARCLIYGDTDIIQQCFADPDDNDLKDEASAAIDLKATSSNPLIKGKVRDASNLNNIFTRLKAENISADEEKNALKYYIQVISGSRLKAYEVNDLTSESGVDIVKFKDLELKQDDVVRLVFANRLKSERDSEKDLLKLGSSTDLLSSSAVAEVLSYDEDKGYEVKKDVTLKTLEITCAGRNKTPQSISLEVKEETPEEGTPEEKPEDAETNVTISFDVNGGTGTIENVIQAKNTEFTLPTAEALTAPAGQEFDAWDIGGTRYNPDDKVNIAANTQIKALWKAAAPVEPEEETPETPEEEGEEKVTITFEANGGTGTMESVEAKKGEYKLPANTFDPPVGKEFVGWLVGDSKTPQNAGKEITLTGDVTLKPKWESPSSTSTWRRKRSQLLNALAQGDEDKFKNIYGGLTNEQKLIVKAEMPLAKNKLHWIS